MVISRPTSKTTSAAVAVPACTCGGRVDVTVPCDESACANGLGCWVVTGSLRRGESVTLSYIVVAVGGARFPGRLHPRATARKTKITTVVCVPFFKALNPRHTRYTKDRIVPVAPKQAV